MDKSTDSSNTSGGGPNHGSSSGDTPMRDISLGCGPSSSSASAAASNNSASTSAGGASASSAAHSVAIPLPLGAPLPVTLQCAPVSCARSTLMQPINLNISTTTGGNFGVTVDPQISVENLKKIIAKKLKVAKDRICLLHREKELQDGTLKDNNLMDGSKIILIPNVETGLLAQRPENTVMQALESLNDSQVNDFLSGKTPLNLSMRLGDHMMLIQLQLSTVNPVNGTSINGSSCNSSRTRSSSQRSRAAAGAAVAAAAAAHHHSHSHHHHHHHHPNVGASATTSASGLSSSSSAAAAAGRTDRPSTVSRIHTTSAGPSSSSSAAGSSATTAIKSSDLSSFLSKRDYESLQNIVKSIAMAQPARLVAPIVTSNHSTNVAPTAHVQHTLTTPSMSAATVCPAIAHSQPLRTLTPVPSSTSSAASGFHTPSEASLLEQSPIKSLSNLVSSPIKTTAIKNIPITNGSNSSSASTTITTNNSNNHTSLTSNGISASSSVAVSAAAAASAVAACQDPISAKLTSCLCTRLNGGSNNMVAVNKNCIESACVSRHNVNGDHHYAAGSQPRTVMLTSTPNNNYKTCVAAAPSAVTTLLHKTANNPITRSKHRHHHHHHHHHHHYHNNSSGVSNSNASSSSCGSANSGTSLVVRPKAPLSPRCASVASMASSSNDSGFASDDSAALASTSTTVAASPKTTTTATLLPPQSTTVPAPVAVVTSSGATSSTSPVELDDSGMPVSDTRTLAEASRNLTQTLRKLSKEVFTNKIDLSGGDEAQRKSGSGAVIESMKNHGKGIYSGTFSGTLNPALQDRYGRPKRDISTVIHILNDLLSATPQYSRGARISFEAPSTSAAAATAASSGALHSTRTKQLSVKHHQHSCVKCIKTQAHSHSSTSSSTTTTSNSSTVCAYGECNGHYVSKSQAKSNYACCQDLSTTGQASTASNPSESSERHVCACRYRIVGETGEREREHMCQKCHVDQDNLKTKSKLDQLRLVMQQRKQKREARKLKGAPYGTRLVGIATANSVSTAVVGSVTAGGVNGLNATTTAAHTSSSSNAATTTPLNNVPTQPTTNNNSSSNNSSEVSPNHIVEEVDTAA